MFLFGGGLLGIATLVVWAYCIFDVIATDESLIRNMPKLLWLVVVIFLPAVGAVAWLALGRPQRASLWPGGSQSAPPAGRPGVARRSLGPEDSPEFMASMEERKRLEEWEKDLRRREEELRRREQNGEGPTRP